MQDLITQADSGFGSSTGFSINAITKYSGDNLTYVFMGSLLGIVFGLRFWIAAVLVIAAVLYFTRRAYQFFRH
jgi:hypothetical protein